MGAEGGPTIRHAPLAGAAAMALTVLVSACATGPAPISRPVGPPMARAQFVPHSYSQCVPYARELSGVSIYGDASTWWLQAGAEGFPRTYSPVQGSVMVLQVNANGTRGHVAYVQKVVSNREIIVSHANWHGRGEVAVNVPVIDVSPNNDWSEVKVFWLETYQMGARTYPVQGFVLRREAFAAGA
jgi:hypothetical protein